MDQLLLPCISRRPAAYLLTHKAASLGGKPELSRSGSGSVITWVPYSSTVRIRRYLRTVLYLSCSARTWKRRPEIHLESPAASHLAQTINGELLYPKPSGPARAGNKQASTSTSKSWQAGKQALSPSPRVCRLRLCWKVVSGSPAGPITHASSPAFIFYASGSRRKVEGRGKEP